MYIYIYKYTYIIYIYYIFIKYKHHDPAVGQRGAAPGLAGGQQDGGHRLTVTEARRVDGRRDRAHDVVDRQASVHLAAARVDQDRDGRARLSVLQVQQLGDDRLRGIVINGARDKHLALFCRQLHDEVWHGARLLLGLFRGGGASGGARRARAASGCSQRRASEQHFLVRAECGW